MAPVKKTRLSLNVSIFLSTVNFLEISPANLNIDIKSPKPKQNFCQPVQPLNSTLFIMIAQRSAPLRADIWPLLPTRFNFYISMVK